MSKGPIWASRHVTPASFPRADVVADRHQHHDVEVFEVGARTLRDVVELRYVAGIAQPITKTPWYFAARRIGAGLGHERRARWGCRRASRATGRKRTSVAR